MEEGYQDRAYPGAGTEGSEAGTEDLGAGKLEGSLAEVVEVGKAVVVQPRRVPPLKPGLVDFY